MTEAYRKRTLVFITATVLLGLSLGLGEDRRKVKNRNQLVKSAYPAKYQRRSSFCLQMATQMDETAILRFHRETERCYRIGERGPCGDFQVFTIEDATFGICDCDHSLRCGRPLILWPSKNRCYYAYDQGPCREGKWLVFGADLHPVCKRNPCLDQENQDPSHDNRYWFSYKNKCYKTYSRGYCDEGKILFNEKTNFRPTCVTTPDCATGPTGRGTIQSLACLPGQRLDFYGKCKRQFKPLKPLKNQTDLAIRVTQRPTNIYCLFCKQF